MTKREGEQVVSHSRAFSVVACVLSLACSRAQDGNGGLAAELETATHASPSHETTLPPNFGSDAGPGAAQDSGAEPSAYAPIELPPIPSTCLNPVGDSFDAEIDKYLSTAPGLCEWVLSFDAILVGEIAAVSAVLDKFVTQNAEGATVIVNTCPAVPKSELAESWIQTPAIEISLQVTDVLWGDVEVGSVLSVYGRGFDVGFQGNDSRISSELKVRVGLASFVSLAESGRLPVGGALGIGVRWDAAHEALVFEGQGYAFTAQGDGEIVAPKTDCRRTPKALDGMLLVDAKASFAACANDAESIEAAARQRERQTYETLEQLATASECRQHFLLGSGCESDDDCRGYYCVEAACSEAPAAPMPEVYGELIEGNVEPASSLEHADAGGADRDAAR